MKKIAFFLLSIVATLTSCHQSPIDKVNALIKEEVLSTLLIPSSYDPVRTQLDSAFAPYDDPVFHKQTAKLKEKEAELRDYKAKAKRAKSSMNIWSDSYSALGKNEYQESKTEYQKYNQKVRATEKSIKELNSIINKKKQERPKFIGFKVTHRYRGYRAESNSGLTLMHDDIFLIDRSMSKIIFTYENEDDVLQQFIDLIEKGIKSINE